MKDLLSPRVIARLDALAARSNELLAQSADPNVFAQPRRMAAVQRELGALGATVRRYEQYLRLLADVREHSALLEDVASDPELRDLAREELPELEARARRMADELIDGLLASEGDGQRSAIVEIRAGTGGDEAALWARDLRDMYVRYCERAGFTVEVLDASETELGGLREVVFAVHGDGVFHRLQFESGGHRVQRVPATETQGRIHTSAATVAVLRQAEEVDIEIKDSDLEMQAVRASGPGGQNVNKVSSAVRLTHLPSGLSVFCQEDRSQLRNRQKALELLRTRLYEMERQRVDAERAAERKAQIGTGDRNARIRTYNFPQNRVTDHRLGENFGLESIVQGRLDPLIEALLRADRQARIAEL
ncbi:MAG: peptide chain release factor 1 [Planctomycetota bacterium]